MITKTFFFLLLAFLFCAAGCLLYGLALPPESEQGTFSVVVARGDGAGAEQRVRCLMWLRSCGLLRCRVILADGGLDAAGLCLARSLTRRWPALEFLSQADLSLLRVDL